VPVLSCSREWKNNASATSGHAPSCRRSYLGCVDVAELDQRSHRNCGARGCGRVTLCAYDRPPISCMCIGGCGGKGASQHPAGTGKSFRVVRACVRAVPVMSFRNENLRRAAGIFYLWPWEVVSFILWQYVSFGAL
jgi:hypothetical protein